MIRFIITFFLIIFINFLCLKCINLKGINEIDSIKLFGVKSSLYYLLYYL